VLLAWSGACAPGCIARSHEVTDNAQIEGHVVPVISKVSGFIDRVYISDNQQVREGDTLVVLDRRDLEAKLSQAEADAAAARIAAGGSAVAAGRPGPGPGRRRGVGYDDGCRRL
jgi:multidrug resistance efflux pump